MASIRLEELQVFHVFVAQIVLSFGPSLGQCVVLTKTATHLAQLAVEWRKIVRCGFQAMHAGVLTKQFLVFEQQAGYQYNVENNVTVIK